MIKEIKEWCSKKPKPEELAEAIIALIPDEEWEKLNFSYCGKSGMDIREWIKTAAQGVRCSYSMDKSLRLAKATLRDAQFIANTQEARQKVIIFVTNELFK